MDQVWPYILTAVGITGFLLVGRKIWWAWYINLGGQVLWIAFVLATEQWGFLLSVIFYIGVFGKNAYDWTREHQALQDDLDSEPISMSASIASERMFQGKHQAPVDTSAATHGYDLYLEHVSTHPIDGVDCSWCPTESARALLRENATWNESFQKVTEVGVFVDPPPKMTLTEAVVYGASDGYPRYPVILDEHPTPWHVFDYVERLDVLRCKACTLVLHMDVATSFDEFSQTTNWPRYVYAPKTSAAKRQYAAPCGGTADSYIYRAGTLR